MLKSAFVPSLPYVSYLQWRASAAASAPRNLKIGMSSKINVKELLSNIFVNGKTLLNAVDSVASGLSNIQASLSLYVSSLR